MNISKEKKKYTTKNAAEISEEISKVRNVNQNKNKRDANKYIARNLKNLRASTAKIAGGSMIVVSVAIGPKKDLPQRFKEPISMTTQYKQPSTYIVQKGDRLINVYLKTGVREEKIKRLNNLSNDEIIPGQILRLI
jgi:LysM repeat protein